VLEPQRVRAVIEQLVHELRRDEPYR
jgi:hypothetical protein